MNFLTVNIFIMACSLPFSIIVLPGDERVRVFLRMRQAIISVLRSGLPKQFIFCVARPYYLDLAFFRIGKRYDCNN